jgi:hypothetical protein
MSLKDYFDNAKGYGVLATADAAGKVNTAIYSRPTANVGTRHRTLMHNIP